MATARRVHFCLSFYLQFFFAASVFSQSCYFPNGSRAPADVPCSSDEFTFCCRHNDICMSNGVCLHSGHQPYTISRGSCTDKSWKSGNCPSVCRDKNPKGGATIINAGYDESHLYCCFGVFKKESSIECSDGDKPFTLPSGTMILGRAALANFTSSASQSDSTAEPTSTSTSSSTPESTDGGASASSTNIAIGAGVGIPLALIALAALGWAVFERRKRRHYLAQAPYVPGNHPSSEVKHHNFGWGRRPPAELSGGDVHRPELEGEQHTHL